MSRNTNLTYMSYRNLTSISLKGNMPGLGEPPAREIILGLLRASKAATTIRYGT